MIIRRLAPGLMALGLAALGLAGLALPAAAHFQEIIPAADVLPEGGPVTVDLAFTHPMEGGPAMEMPAPQRVGVVTHGEITDLSEALRPAPIDGSLAWTLTHDLAEPGAAVFFVAPAPYWEPSEGKFIVHYAKVVVDSHASGEGWDALVGLPVEILPLSRPTGLWTGNLFSGVVLKGGAPVPFARIEIAYRNDGSLAAPNDAFVTQVLKADASGTFHYAMPRAGWWGFAALVAGDQPMTSPEGAEVPVEEGALIWVRTTDMGGQ